MKDYDFLLSNINIIKGIGSKTAQRIIVDLKDKLSQINDSSDIIFDKIDNTIKQEALSALNALGFGKKIAESKIEKVLKMNPDIDNVEELARWVWQNRFHTSGWGPVIGGRLLCDLVLNMATSLRIEFILLLVSVLTILFLFKVKSLSFNKDGFTIIPPLDIDA